ncbi:hypothetical protein V5N11_002793 [Cardamine amara subsp. amara]|uniref:DUF577 domain-containing protein n=1 Tax=Cardamine amara subsp. amara TaxID=228776 RepID=A0ABD1C6B3_CARAN
MTMAESSNLPLKARDLLASSSHEGVAILVEHLSMPQDTNKYQTALALYDFCAYNFPNCLTLMLLKVYRFSSSRILRLFSLNLLSETLAEFRNHNFDLSRATLHEIKPLLISCLTMQETKESDMKILRRIVSLIVYNVMICDNGGWLELSDCILWLANTEPLKAFHVFVDLSSVYGTFIFNFMEIIVKEAEKVLLNPEQCGVEDWSLALETVVKMGIQLLDTEVRYDLIKNLLNILVKSVKDLVEKGMESFLVQGLDHLERFLSQDKILYNYNKKQCLFVRTFMYEIRNSGTQTKEIMRKINKLVKQPDEPAIKHIPSVIQPKEKQDHGEELDRRWYDHLKTLSSLEVLRIFASTDHEDMFRELAIRRLNVLLSDHTLKNVELDISEFRELQPLLISCLKEEGVSDSMFKVLGEVVNHVAYELFVYQHEKWDGLRDYIASQSKTEFQRAVYIFQCLTMALLDDDFVIPVLDNLLPEIMTRLSPPRELLVDNICWVLAFTGAFCAAIHLVEIPSHAESAKEIADKMIDSVRELVERKMEVGLVRRAFRDVENIVKKQMKWYEKSEYKFIKGLLWRLYAIKGMKWESKIVLWRINVIVERGVDAMAKELPEDVSL